MKDSLCPCGSGKYFTDCCGPLLDGSNKASSPEALMRSRYTAFVKNDEAYLLKTWHPSTRPKSLVLDEPVKWLSLKIKSFSMSDETHGSVHFIARGLIGGRGFKQEENSSFVLEDGQWYYEDGKLS